MVLIAAALVLVGHLSTNYLEFSQYNTGWNGTSRFFSDLDRHRLVEISEPFQLMSNSTNTTLLIIAPWRQPTDQELSGYRAFIERGNTIILADDFGTGNQILRGLKSRISILPGNVSSLDRKYADPYSVVVYPSGNETLIENIPSLLLNRPAPLRGGTPIMQTSVMSWVDLNGDRKINNFEVLGAINVIASDNIGNGRIIVVSDPSIFINSMYDFEPPYNRIFMQNLVNGNEPVLIDQMNSRTRDAEGANEILHLIKTKLMVELLFVCVLMLFVAWIWKRKII
ncbi:MAG: DUF4350 domain-containing protein [Methanoregula sp.]|nr:DUF4350 domain-containing protein [Methanoregula sp.]